MAGEIQAYALTPAGTFYAFLLDANGQVWNGSAFVAYAVGDWATYDVALVESLPGVFFGTMPAVAAGSYRYLVYEQAGGSPASTDSLWGASDILWDGAAVLVPAEPGAAMTLTGDYDAAKTAGTSTLTAQQVWEYATRILTALDEDDTSIDIDGSVPTAAAIASQVRTELATELARIDAAITTRLATTGYTAPDNANISTIAAAVAHVTYGLSALQALIAAIPTAAAPTTAQIKTALEAAGSHLALIKAATDNLPSDPADQSILAAAIAAVALQITALGALAITVQSPVAESGVITIYQGNDYVTAEGTALLITVAVAGAPDLTGATVRLKLIQDTWVATACTSDGTNWTIAFEPDKTEAAALSVGAQPYELEATLASGSVRDLSNGTAIVVRDIPIVP